MSSLHQAADAEHSKDELDESLAATTSFSIEELKHLLSNHLRGADRLRRPDGIATGLEPLDRFLLWGGIPKGAMSYFGGSLGSGATSLWIDTAANVIREGKWVAWINHDIPLCPLSLHHKEMNLERFVAVEMPAEKIGQKPEQQTGRKKDPQSRSNEKLLWLLQELMSTSLFDLIGCDLGSTRLKEHQLRKLQTQTRQAHVALVFIGQNAPSFRARSRQPDLPRGSMASVYSLIIGFEPERFVIERASHRPAPHILPRSVSYARFTLHTTDRSILGTQHSTPERAPNNNPSPLPEAPRTSVNGVQKSRSAKPKKPKRR